MKKQLLYIEDRVGEAGYSCGLKSALLIKLLVTLIPKLLRISVNL
jgi:hypothetical protein